MFKVFDEDNDSNINMKEWVCGFSKFLRGTNKEKMDCKYLIKMTILYNNCLLEHSRQE